MKKFYHDKVMNAATLKDRVSGPNRETKSLQVMLTWWTDLVATKEFNVAAYFKLNSNCSWSW